VGILDKLLGRPSEVGRGPMASGRVGPEDAEAIERYRYLLRTAPPDAMERAHAEAFARLTPEQRAEVLRRFGESLPAAELADARSGDPAALARAATRAEVREPGYLERTLGRGGLGMGGGFGGFGSSLLGSLAGSFIGTAIASQLLHGFGGAGLDPVASGWGVAGKDETDFSDVDSGSDPMDSDLDGVDDVDAGGFDDV
jgi:hypothetical protein